TLWDRSTRVPLIFAGPKVEQGRCTQPAELLDIYPTLVDLCDLPPKSGLEGRSLMPQLKDASTPRTAPAITTHNHDNHGVRSEKWRFIQYADGSEELYDMEKDPNEWTNLADNPEYGKILEKHRGWLPNVNRKPAPGSRHRVLVYQDGKANWQGEDIASDDPIPEL
ncbi:MAG: sulfatase/phosphatase domain-containing protein, partial [Verrucomicrobiota bacterium]